SLLQELLSTSNLLVSLSASARCRGLPLCLVFGVELLDLLHQGGHDLVLLSQLLLVLLLLLNHRLGPVLLGKLRVGYAVKDKTALNAFVREMRALVSDDDEVKDHHGLALPESVKARLDGALQKFHCNLDQPSNTIVGKVAVGVARYWRCVTPLSDSYYTVAEFKRFQSIPDHVPMMGANINGDYLQIGNAVPYLMAKAWGKSILEAFKKGRRW
ncbi:hypothetical protein CYMTET_40496, partial [Cymbomonas tetramitiformis]